MKKRMYMKVLIYTDLQLDHFDPKKLSHAPLCFYPLESTKKYSYQKKSKSYQYHQLLKQLPMDNHLPLLAQIAKETHKRLSLKGAGGSFPVQPFQFNPIPYRMYRIKEKTQSPKMNKIYKYCSNRSDVKFLEEIREDDGAATEMS